MIKSTADLSPAVYNPRKISGKQASMLKKSMEEFGDLSGIVVNIRTGNMIGGHQRINNLSEDCKIVKKSFSDNIGTVATGYIQTDNGRWHYREVDWDEIKEKAANIAANKHGGEWDLPKLNILLEDLKSIDFEMEIVGFDKVELKKLLVESQTDSPEVNAPATEIIKSGSLEALAPTAEEMEILKGKKILIQFSGGKDSSSAAIWVKQFLPDNEVELCFCDMGADFPGFALFLKKFSEQINYKLKVLRSDVGMIEHILEKGRWPHFMHPYCHDVLYGTLNEYIREHNYTDIVIMRGGRLQERKTQNGVILNSRFSEFSDKKNYIFFQPVYFAAKNVAENVLEESNALVWNGYRHGLQRTACRICPGQKPHAYSAIRINYPDVWEELLELERRFGAFAWGKHTAGRHWSFTEMADHGKNKFEKGNYLARQTTMCL